MSILDTLLPWDCLLCGQADAGGLLCPACARMLPVATESQCPLCADSSPGGPCGACLKNPPRFDSTTAPFRYSFPVDKLVQALKYRHRLAIADFWAKAMLAGPRPTGDLMVPVPLSRERLRERGFNQAQEIARPLARALGLPLRSEICLRRRDTTPQATLPWKERRRNVRHAFECIADLSGLSVIVIDDVMTTGATLDEMAASLKAAGASRVSNWVVARAVGQS